MDQLGSYTLFEALGHGGMGSVCRGRHTVEGIALRQGGDVAVKVLHAQFASNPSVARRFRREAEIGIKLHHPHIVRALDLVQDAGRVGLVMELASGKTLAARIEAVSGPIPWEQARPIFLQILDAVSHAHEHGVVHRDLKPANLVIDSSDHLKVLDFGIAKIMSHDITLQAVRMGTVSYMAPEQHEDANAVDPRADIYALGLTLYEMLAGRLPWESSISELVVLERKKTGQIPPPSEYYPHIPPHVVAAISRACQARIEDRYPSVEKFRSALESTLVEELVPQPVRPEPTLVESTPEPTPPEPTHPSAKGKSGFLYSFILTLVTVGGLGWFIQSQFGETPKNRRFQDNHREEEKASKFEPLTIDSETCEGKIDVLEVLLTPRSTELWIEVSGDLKHFLVYPPGDDKAFRLQDPESGEIFALQDVEDALLMPERNLTNDDAQQFGLHFEPLSEDTEEVHLIEGSPAVQGPKKGLWRCEGIWVGEP